MNLVLYSDDATEAEWFKNLNPSFRKLKSNLILPRGKNIKIINEIVKYDRPDIILLNDSIPILVVEKTREVPTGHNVGQRMARLVRALELKIPTIYFFPFDARKHGEHTGICNMNARVLFAFKNMWKIHDCPIVALNWITDEGGELIGDGSEDVEIIKIIKELEEESFSSKSKIYNKLRVDNKNEYLKRIKLRKSYSKKPASVYQIKTNDLVQKFKKKLSKKSNERLMKCNDSIIYKIVMSEAKCKRQDPYTGTQFIYDYCYCRKGKNINDKKMNLILYFPEIRKNVWLEKNPNNLDTKSSNWYLIANALMFKDDILILR
jgi:hypothetical protein